MCGIAGQARFDGGPVDKLLVEAMSECLMHRGPDGGGLWSDAMVAVAHRRLAIRDLGQAGAQPVLSNDKSIVVSFNGEIYNDKELRAELAHNHGAFFDGHCDSEVIPAGYAAWGDGVFHRLEGMFAIALWDKRRELLYLVRDGIGIKPLVYKWQDGQLFFASEIKALTHVTGHPDNLDPAALHAYLAKGYVGPEGTLIPGVKQVPPGSWLKFSQEGIESHRFWTPARSADLDDSVKAQQEFLDLFHLVCRDMLVADVPVGIFQSGGIDSSLISMTLKDPAIPLFTAGFNNPEFDEASSARVIAESIGAPLNILMVDEVEELELDFRRVIWHFDGQVADSSSLAFFRLARGIRKHVKVALSGDGADEFFAGYGTYRATQIAASIGGAIPTGLLETLAKMALKARSGTDARYPSLQILGRLLQGLRSGMYSHAEWRRYAMPWECQQLYGIAMLEYLAIDPLEDYKRSMNKQVGGTILDRAMLADQVHYLPGDMLLKADAMSMAHGLEVRVPFLDRRIMDFAGRLSPKLLGGMISTGPKRFLRRALADRGAPRSIVSRRKTGFNVPVADMLRGHLSRLATDVFERRSDAFSPYLEPGAVRALWLQHRDGMVDHGYLLWTLLTLGIWWRRL